MTSQGPNRITRSKAFKVSVLYKGEATDIYNNAFYPRYVQVRRYNFPKRLKPNPEVGDRPNQGRSGPIQGSK